MTANSMLDYYSEHSIFTDPGKYAVLYEEISNDIKDVINVVQGLIINPLDEDIHNISLASQQRAEVHMRTAAQMLATIQKFNSSPISIAREPSQRISGVGRHFVLLVLSILRHKKIPARMRVGFARYLTKKKNEDRWLVEYWDREKENWRLIDPCIDDYQREYYNIDFDTLDLKYMDHFYLAGHAWKLSSEGTIKPNDFGYKNWGGKRFIRNNLIRDIEGLNKIELLPWDFFGILNQKLDNELNADENKLVEQFAELSVDADNTLMQIRRIFDSISHSKLISSKLQLLGLKGNMKMADINSLKSDDSVHLDVFQSKDMKVCGVSRGKNVDTLFNSSDSINALNSSLPIDSNNILVRGARQHNLKNIDIDIPRSKLVVVTGVSGSGKSSFAFDTIYAEAQRRFVGSFSGSSNQYSERFDKPDVDQIIGLNPCIAIEQKNNSANPRSTVGSLTDIYDYLRLLFVRVGTFHCPKCGKAVQPYNSRQIARKLSSMKPGTDFRLLAPLSRDKKTKYASMFKEFLKDGYENVRIGMTYYIINSKVALVDKNTSDKVELLIDRLIVPNGSDKEKVRFDGNLDSAVKKAMNIGSGTVIISIEGEEDIVFSNKNMCTECNIEFADLKTSSFNHNHPEGMCPECDGLGVKLSVNPDLIITMPNVSMLDGACKIYGEMRKTKKSPNSVTAQIFALAENMGVDLEQPWNKLSKEFQHAVLYGTGEECVQFSYEVSKGGRSTEIKRPVEGLVNMINRLYRQTKGDKSKEAHLQYMSEQPCPVCQGECICTEARYVTVGNMRYPQIVSMSISDIKEWITSLPELFSDEQYSIAKEILKDIWVKVQFLMDVGLHYLSLERKAPTLSGGEVQRIRLASQLGCSLVGIMYVFDEPSIGLHSRDHQSLLKAMTNLRDSGNTVLVVEHDADTMRAADYMFEIGPGAGVLGGQLIAKGTPFELMANPLSLTGRYLKGELEVATPNKGRRRKASKWLNLIGARANNLKNISVRFPIGLFTCVTGVSGSGKSSLVGQVLAPALCRLINNSQDIPGPYNSIEGLEYIDKVIRVNQASIGRTPRSNPATYTEVFDEIRKVFAKTEDALSRGLTSEQFSFNNKEGRCESCEGIGMKKIELHFMPDMWIKCQECNGQRYNPSVLEVMYKGKTISDVLNMDVSEAMEFFGDNDKIRKSLKTLYDVGLDYIKLGQSTLTLSGGEAQRMKLAKELCRPDTGKTLYILDEPTTGLHFADIQKLLNVLHYLTDKGNTVIIIEHNLDVIKTADWIIDIGPEGGKDGGSVVAQGTPEEIINVEQSYTGKFLKELL